MAKGKLSLSEDVPSSPTSSVDEPGASALGMLWTTIRSLTTTTTDYHKSSVRGSDSARSLHQSGIKSFTMEEVALHNTPEDCWIVIKDRVYDVSGWGDDHPGGPVIYTQGGRDGTDTFSTFHAASTWRTLNKHYLGDLVTENVPAALEADFRAARNQMKADGLFTASASYYAFKVAGNLAIALTAAAMLLAAADSTAAYWGSAFLLGLFWQQSGWLAHDFCHNQVFANRAHNRRMGFFLGNVTQGFSVDWWKRKHNTHHAVPNATDQEHFAVDPDIDTLPLLAWSKDMLGTSPDSARGLLRVQHWLLFPVLLFARLVWAQQSIAHAVAMPPGGRRTVELATLAAHYGWYLGLAFTALPAGAAVVWAVAAQMISGLMLSLVFIQSHNAMEVYSEPKDFWSAQMVSTRNITSNAWTDWFTGGLNYQIEHHLFPTMPRHNLGRCAAYVRPVCAKHGVVYEDCTMTLGTRRVLQRLADVAAHA